MRTTAWAEEEFLSLLDAAPDAILLVDRRGHIVFANIQAEKIFGYERGGLSGEPVEILMPKRFRSGHQHLHDIFFADPHVRSMGKGRELIGLTKDGVEFPAEISLSPFIRSGETVGCVAMLADISDRRRAEEALRESEERYRLLFENNPQPMWVFDLETLRFMEVNEAAVQHYGYSRREFLSMRILDIRPIEDVPKLLEMVASTAAPVNRAGIWRHPKKDGTILHVEITETRFELRGRRAALILANDVTDRKLAEDKLRLLAAALEATANAIVITDTHGEIQWVNRAFEQLTGHSRIEVLGQNPRLLRSGLHDEVFYKELWETILKGDCWQGELVNQRKDGTLYTEYQTITPVRDASGGISNFVGVKEDITHRKQAEEALRRSEAAYRMVVEGAPYGIYRVNHAGQILRANRALAQMLGYDSEQEILRINTITDVYWTPEERSRSVEHWAGRDEVSAYETRWKDRHGKPLTVLLAGRRVSGTSSEDAIYEVFAENITEQRLLEEQLRQAQKMEAVGRLAGGVAHDFNNLLMIINSYAEMLLEDRKASEKARNYVNHILEAGKKAVSVTQQLLAFSRRQVLQPKVVDLNSVLKGLQKMLPRLVGEDIEMVFSLSTHLGRVRLDQGQIEQVVMNLAVNARDAMPGGGKLMIETRNVTIGPDYVKTHVKVPPGEYAMLAVSDTGTGMDAETQKRIFEPFFTTKSAGKGTGLGLATVYGIVKQSGGFIWVYSEPHKGTTFKLYFPTVEGRAEKAVPETAEVVPTGSETVLVVEDEAALRIATRELLQSKGYTVLDAASGLEALRLAQTGKVDVLLTDMIMPGMTGIELAKNVVELHPDSRVIYMSGYTDRVLELESLPPGTRFLQKPFSLSVLAKTIRAVLQETSRRSRG